MDLEDKERDPFDTYEAFEGFGDVDDDQEIDLRPEPVRAEPSRSEQQRFETLRSELQRAEPVRSEPRPIETLSIDTETVAANENQKIKTGFSWAAFGGGLAAIVWIAGAIGGPVSYYGVDAVMALDPAVQAGIIALAFGPAVLFWLGAAAAGEALKARRLAAALTKLAQEQHSPIAFGEVHAHRITANVKSELDAINDAVTAALSRLTDLECAARRNVALFEDSLAASRENDQYIAARIAGERDQLAQLRTEMRGDTDAIAHSVGRQVRLMREASKLVKTEISAAEEAMESRLHSFSDAASIMAERTASFHQVADTAASATASLNTTMSDMLDSLGEATKLTDATRQSAEQATLAANETAAAVRETTRNAVFEAKRAAQAIRAETEALQQSAVTTMERLRDAALAAREASEASQAAADRHAASIEKRLAALAQTAGAQRKAAAPAPAPQVEQRAPVVERKPVVAQHQPRYEEEARDDLRVAASAAISRSAARPQTRAYAEPANEPRKSFGPLKGMGSWGNLFPQREEPAPKAANEPEEADAFALVDFGSSRRDPDTVLKTDAIELVIAAGVDLDGSLSAADLDNVAQRSRLGAVARRRAVTDAAPAAVSRIARHLKRNADAKVVASEFRARPDLAKSEKKGEASDLVRAYLLIDAALA